MADAVFESSMQDVLGECISIGTQRGTEYLDSWHLDNLVTTLTQTTLQRFGVRLEPDQVRLLLLAALVDVKFSRIKGPHKRDSYIDAINYLSCYASLREQYETE
jgi:hypothetical protein